MTKQISGERKAVYYIGLVLTIIGVLTFLSTFLTVFDDSPMGFSEHSFGSPSKQFQSFGARGFGGFIMIAIGAVLMTVGKAGLAGSGIILDPEKAKEDLEPWNRSKGGMINDTLDEIDVVKGIANNLSKSGSSEEKTVVKIRCHSCGELNDEDAKFCKECGSSM